MGVNFIQEQKYIEGVMLGLMKVLCNMAAHPDRPHLSGPLFAQIAPDSKLRPAPDYDGMLGSMFFDSFLGSAFSGASSGTSATRSFDWSLMADAYSEYMQDHKTSSPDYKLGQKSMISSNFNDRSSLFEAYFRDLPRRLGIEKWLATYQRKLYSLRKQARLNPSPATAFAAAIGP